MLRASAACEAAGFPTSSLTCEGFVKQAAVTSVGLGLPNIPVALVPGHIGMKTPQELRDDILNVTMDENRNLTGSFDAAGVVSGGGTDTCVLQGTLEGVPVMRSTD